MKRFKTWLVVIFKEWGIDARKFTWPWESRELIRLRQQNSEIRDMHYRNSQRYQQEIAENAKAVCRITDAAAKVQWEQAEGYSNERIYRLVIDLNSELLNRVFQDYDREFLAKETARKVEQEIRSGKFIQDAHDHKREQERMSRQRFGIGGRQL